MRTWKKNVLLTITLLLVLTMLGCSALKNPVQITLPSISVAHDKPAQSDGIQKRFKEPTEQSQTAIESAIELAKKNAEFAEQAVRLRRQNRELITETARLKSHIVVIEPKLEQAQKELTEANDLLVEMRIELNNWKADILGFRNEIRQAEKSQLQALIKILKMLGGEVETDSARQMYQDTDPALTVSSVQP